MNSKATIVMLAILTVLASANVSAAIEIHPKCKPLLHKRMGPFVNLNDGRVLAVTASEALISKDEGKSWDSRPLFADPKKFQTRGERALLRTRNGVIVLAFLNESERSAGKWDTNDRDALSKFYLPTYVTRSFDEGKTWETPRRIQSGWCGAMRSLIQLGSGRLVLTGQQLVFDPGRHVVLSHVSDDDGKSWKRSNMIDLGGAGSHGGAMEAAVAELSDGRVYMLIRTPKGWFWEAFSSDEGLTWSVIRQSKIRAPSAPPGLLTLQSGRLLLVCNLHRDKTCGYRDELSMAFSKDDGQTWTDPVVLARNRTPKGGDQYRHMLAYPYVFERRPGELWVTTFQGMVRISLREADFVKTKK